jgi:SAM-dependent methyltransferase
MYHETRFNFDQKREVLWQTLVEHFFQKSISSDANVLELGCGYGHFINNVKCAKKYAVDTWSGAAGHLAKGITFISRPVWQLEKLPARSIDYVFASNLFEHITQAELEKTLSLLKKKTKPGAKLVILQPNFRYAFREYFDDYTHKTIYTDVGLADLLQANGLEIERVFPKFLPLSIKSRFPVSKLLIRAYLLSPFKFQGKQMLIIARFT